MLIQRTLQNLKAQNWTGITIDFAIVVAGVFLGIQASNLNDERIEAKAYRDLLDQLQRELTVLANHRKKEVRALNDRWDVASGVMPPLLSDVRTTQIGERACLAITRSHIVETPADDLPALREILALSQNRPLNGKHNTINEEIQKFIVARAVERARFAELSKDVFRLMHMHPDLFHIEYVENPKAMNGIAKLGEHAYSIDCNLDAMKRDDQFIADYLDNLGRLVKLRNTHQRLDESIDALSQALALRSNS